MSSTSTVFSKILVLDSLAKDSETIKALCEDSALIAIRPQEGGAANVLSILGSNIDLGGIMLHENYGGPMAGVALARSINDLRPELPIFLRRDRQAGIAGLADTDAAMFRCAYTAADLSTLRASLDSSIFNRVYPTALVRGIAEITQASLGALLPHCDLVMETPYLVKDRIIFGEVFTLIGIETNWCRGYMMLQTGESDFLGLAMGDRDPGEALTFRDLNSILGEATNMIWGGFKSRYANHTGGANIASSVQVPIIINHQRRFISFGSEDPQLCLKYQFRDRKNPDAEPVYVYQRFVFNLNWSPEDMVESPAVESMFESGELELF